MLLCLHFGHFYLLVLVTSLYLQRKKNPLAPVSGIEFLGQTGQRAVATTAISNAPNAPLIAVREATVEHGRYIFAPLSNTVGLIFPTDLKLLASSPKLPITAVHPICSRADIRQKNGNIHLSFCQRLFSAVQTSLTQPGLWVAAGARCKHKPELLCILISVWTHSHHMLAAVWTIYTAQIFGTTKSCLWLILIWCPSNT